MPTYDYECSTCGVTFEKRQGFTEAPVTEYADCPNNQQGCNIRRMLSSPTIVFKGKGFYVTDNKSSNRHIRTDDKKSAKSEEKPESKSESEAKTEFEAASPTRE